MYELDRSHWPNFHRPFENYLKSFSALVHCLPNLIVFSDDPRVLLIAEKGGAKCIKKSKEDFSSWKLESTRVALDKKRNKYHFPEFFSEEYICLQLCKADAILEAMNFTSETVFWIDAGIRTLPTSWNHVWKYPDKIHFLQIGSHCFNDYININTPKVHFAGTFWGGKSADMKWFCEQVLTMSQNLLEQGECANDQQIFSIIHRRYPERFWGFKSYDLKTPFFGIWYTANFDHLFMILQDSQQGNVRFTVLYYIQLLLLLIVLSALLYSIVRD